MYQVKSARKQSLCGAKGVPTNGKPPHPRSLAKCLTTSEQRREKLPLIFLDVSEILFKFASNNY
ncbi:MAG: hypothetical protein II612_00450 [Prevotella sp.]|nr:hypothetical protein [Prevotella sp.]